MEVINYYKVKMEPFYIGSPNRATVEQLFFVDTRLFCQIICMLKK